MKDSTKDQAEGTLREVQGDLPDGRNPPIFEKGTDHSRGDATDLDLQQWKDAHKDATQSHG